MAEDAGRASTQTVVDSDGDKQLSGEHQKVLRFEGAADVNAELAEIGLSNKSGWYASVLLYGAGGIVVILAWLLKPEVVPVGLGILGGFALLVSLISAFGARYLLNDDWATHVRLSLGLAIFGAGALLAGDVRVAFAMMPLFVLITPTFLYGARFALPYACVITPMTFLVVLTTPGAAPLAQAAITAGSTLMITVSLMAAEHRTRSLARLNRHLAYTDALTAIANTRRLREVLADTLVAGRRFALFAIDLDNFKEVNDRFGHQVGDRVLEAVAAELVEEVGPGELVARRGGDEFSVLIPEADAIDLDRVAERLSRAIIRARQAACPQVTPSGSVAWVTSEEDDSISSVLQRADDALHVAKQAFRAGAGEEADGAAIAAAPKAVDRQAALRSVSAAVSRAYGGGENGVLRRMRAYRERLDWATSGLSVVWGYLTLTLLPIGLMFVLLAAFGAMSEQPIAVGVVSGLLLIALALFSFQAGRLGVSKNMIFWTLLGAVAVVSWAVAAAGSDGVALLDTYVVLGLFGFYVLRPRYASLLLVLGSALFAGFSLVGDFPFGEIRSAVTIAVMVVAALIIVKVRSITLGFVRENRELSEVDPLTGVANLRALRMRVESAVEHATTASAPGVGRPTLMTIDLDRFKDVNDRYNHTTGDQMLEAVARAISECVRIEEMVARRGGDEFFVLFDNTTSEHVSSVGPRVRSAAAHARSRICPDLTPSVTVGFVAWQPGWDAETFLAEADAIMHSEKLETRIRGYESAANR